ncbi:hypothetical protein [Streptomyces sp. TE33382]
MGDVRRPRPGQDRPHPAQDARPAADLLTDAWNTSAPELPPPPATDPSADRDFLADAWSPTPPAPAPAPAADPDDTTVTPPPPTPAPAPAPTPAPDDAVVGLREAYENHLSETVASLKAMRWARQNDPDFPGPVDKRGAEFLYRAGDLKKWARNRPRAHATDPG